MKIDFQAVARPFACCACDCARSLRRRKFASSALILVVFFLASVGSFAGPWATNGPARWMDLAVSPGGKTGFTLVPATQSGVVFTNWLDDLASAANRVLENGSGVAAGDFDQDGDPDLFLCSLTGDNALFRNLGGWHFENVTQAAGLPAKCPSSRGAVFVDLNGDRLVDLLISTLDRGVFCYLNQGQGRFTDATARAGTESRSGSTTLALADVDGNGTLDLYVTNYRPDDIRDRSRIDIQRVNGKVSVAPALRDRIVLTAQGLLEFGQPDILYLNDGQARFRPLSWTDGAFLDEKGEPLTRPPADWGLTASFRDINGDGWPDLYVCNDYWTPDRFWINQEQGRFRAAPPLALRHTSENSMGVDFADIDRDGHLDFLVLDMLSRDPAMRKRQVLAQAKMPPVPGEVANRPQIMRNALFHARGDGTFEEIADYAGLAATEWSWQPVFLDADLDGYPDLLIPAGHRRDVQDLDATKRIQSLQHPWPKDMDRQAHQEAFTRELMEHARFYPPLAMPILAFRNLGNLRFEESTAAWGTATLGVHQGLALADFDQDGDLDFVVNNLNRGAALYRNESAAPRVAVRLKGLPPNTGAVGARVTLQGGTVPDQTEEIVAGGRYLSGFAPQLMFASGPTGSNLVLAVRWRSGRQTQIAGVLPNRLYEIDESVGGEGEGTARPVGAPEASATSGNAGRISQALFEDVSRLLNHRHSEAPFDDFARQPLVPRKFSQPGPGVAWGDLNADGNEDLVVGAGKGGRMAIYYSTGSGTLAPVTNAATLVLSTRDLTGLAIQGGERAEILAGSSNYEDGLEAGPSVRRFDGTGRLLPDTFPGNRSTVGPLALGDCDGDGDLDLFVGGRVVPGRYPEPAASTLYRREQNAWIEDTPSRALFEKVGMVSGAVWSDLDNDGFPELLLACEWGPVRIFKNDRGRLSEATARWRMAEHTGWWTGVTTADFDGDGRQDIIAGNWGLNHSHRASPERPLRLYFGNLGQRGTVEVIETEFDEKRDIVVPSHSLDFLAAALPFLRERFSNCRAFSEATLEQALGDRLTSASVLQASTLSSTAFLNRDDHFVPVELPREAQFAPVLGVTAADFDGDGFEDVFLSQNWFALPWQTPRQDAGRGLLLKGRGDGRLVAMPGQESGILAYGEQRGSAAADWNHDGRLDLVVAQNGAETLLFRNQGGRPGLRVRLRGPQGNPDGIGAVIRLRFRRGFGSAREIHGGSGYYSQDSAIQVLATPEPADAVVVRWPGGTAATNLVPAGAGEVTIRFADVQ